MKNLNPIFIALVIFILGCKSNFSSMQKEANKPNVIFINVDDLGWKDLGFMDNGYFETPNIDNLATQGMTFTHSYASAANCAPSRACLMTGQYTPRHGVYTVSPSARGKSESRKLIPIKNADSISLNAFTMADMFKEAGYTTGTFGKWHISNNPLLHGFDVNIGGSSRGNPGRNGYFSPYKISNIKNGPKGEHLTDRLTNEAMLFLEKNKDRPFFLYLPYYSVHTPIIAKKHLIEKYKNKKNNPLNINPKYAAMVETVDSNVGRLLNRLEELNLSKNTIVVFTSDNGGVRAISPQDPLRAGKGSYYEGGTRVPCIIRWPGVIKSGTESNDPIINIDFFPTFKEILNTEIKDKVLDGQSLVPIFNGKKMEKRPLFWHFPIYLEGHNGEKDQGRDPLFRTRPGATILYEGWKLHFYDEDQEIELYYLPDDLGEKNNLASTNKTKADELLSMLKSWQKEVKAPVPTKLNPKYNPN